MKTASAGWRPPSILFKEGGIIKSDMLRRPLVLPASAAREGLLRCARKLDPLVLRWGR